MTKVVLSSFFKPGVPGGRTVGPQYLRLASTSLGNTISVETFQLKPRGGRYVLQTAVSRNISSAATTLTVAMVVAVLALLISSLLNPEGSLFNGVIPTRLRDASNQQKFSSKSLPSKGHMAVVNNTDFQLLQHHTVSLISCICIYLTCSHLIILLRMHRKPSLFMTWKALVSSAPKFTAITRQSSKTMRKRRSGMTLVRRRRSCGRRSCKARACGQLVKERLVFPPRRACKH